MAAVAAGSIWRSKKFKSYKEVALAADFIRSSKFVLLGGFAGNPFDQGLGEV